MKGFVQFLFCLLLGSFSSVQQLQSDNGFWGPVSACIQRNINRWFTENSMHSVLSSGFSKWKIGQEDNPTVLRKKTSLSFLINHLTDSPNLDSVFVNCGQGMISDRGRFFYLIHKKNTLFSSRLFSVSPKGGAVSDSCAKRHSISRAYARGRMFFQSSTDQDPQ